MTMEYLFARSVSVRIVIGLPIASGVVIVTVWIIKRLPLQAHVAVRLNSVGYLCVYRLLNRHHF